MGRHLTGGFKRPGPGTDGPPDLRFINSFSSGQSMMALPRLALAVPGSVPEPSPASLGLLAGLSTMRWRVQHFRSRALLRPGTECVAAPPGDRPARPAPRRLAHARRRLPEGLRPRSSRGLTLPWSKGRSRSRPRSSASEHHDRPGGLRPDRQGARPADRRPALLPSMGGPAYLADLPEGDRRRPDRWPRRPRGVRADRFGRADDDEEAGDRRRRGTPRGPPGPGPGPSQRPASPTT